MRKARQRADSETIEATERKALMLKAVELFRTQFNLAAAAGVAPYTVWRAVHTGEVSPMLAVAIDRATGGKIKRDALCSDASVFDKMIKRRSRARAVAKFKRRAVAKFKRKAKPAAVASVGP